MKKLHYSWILILALGFALTACNEDETTEDIVIDEATSSQDLATMQNLMEDVESEVDLQLEELDGKGNGCAEVTVDPEDKSFPRTVTIDFGADGCLGPNGRLRRGKIIVTQNDSLPLDGSVRTATFEDFFIDNVQLEGSKTLTNNGADENGFPSFTREVMLSITYPSDSTASWNSTSTVAQVDGLDTRTRRDDLLEITGASEGVNRRGGVFSSTVLEPLLKRKACPWIESGVREVSVNDRTRTIDYGNGVCDRFALVTFSNGVTRRIRLDAWWQ